MSAAAWFQPLFDARLTPRVRAANGEVLVWQTTGDASTASVTDQFKANAGEYHQRYAASDHFEHLIRQALDAAGVAVSPGPTILDMGSGSGVNSVEPCRRIFPGARMVATDLSAELLAMLASDRIQAGGSEDVVCVVMDAMSDHVAAGAFDLVTGAAILHHLEDPERGLAMAARALKPGGHAVFLEPFNGWAIVRLAFERILAESDLRGDRLDAAVDAALRQLVADVGLRSRLTRRTPGFSGLDDKWLFSRTRMDKWAHAVGFASVRYAPHNDHASLYRDVAQVHLRLTTGRSDLELPAWALAILDSFDEALTLQAKRELMIEGTIILTMPG